MTPTIFIVDDCESVRKALSQLLIAHNLQVTAYASGHEFLAAYHPDHPGCILLDLVLPDMEGRSVYAELRERQALIPVIFLTGYGDITKAVQAVKDGALDFLEKPVQSDQLLKQIRRALVLDREQRQFNSNVQSIQRRLANLTAREREIMMLVTEGQSNKEIAKKLKISYRTVEVHRNHMMYKMNAANLVELVKLAEHCKE